MEHFLLFSFIICCFNENVSTQGRKWSEESQKKMNNLCSCAVKMTLLAPSTEKYRQKVENGVKKVRKNDKLCSYEVKMAFLAMFSKRGTCEKKSYHEL